MFKPTRFIFWTSREFGGFVCNHNLSLGRAVIRLPKGQQTQPLTDAYARVRIGGRMWEIWNLISPRIGRLISCLVSVCTTYLVLLMRGWDMTNDVTASLRFISTAKPPRQRILFPRGGCQCRRLFVPLVFG